jgi:hypothetical protein
VVIFRSTGAINRADMGLSGTGVQAQAFHEYRFPRAALGDQKYRLWFASHILYVLYILLRKQFLVIVNELLASKSQL